MPSLGNEEQQVFSALPTGTDVSRTETSQDDWAFFQHRLATEARSFATTASRGRRRTPSTRSAFV